jgi:hypothetical protein
LVDRNNEPDDERHDERHDGQDAVRIIEVKVIDEVMRMKRMTKKVKMVKNWRWFF